MWEMKRMEMKWSREYIHLHPRCPVRPPRGDGSWTRCRKCPWWCPHRTTGSPLSSPSFSYWEILFSPPVERKKKNRTFRSSPHCYSSCSVRLGSAVVLSPGTGMNFSQGLWVWFRIQNIFTQRDLSCWLPRPGHKFRKRQLWTHKHICSGITNWTLHLLVCPRRRWPSPRRASPRPWPAPPSQQWRPRPCCSAPQ